MTTDTVQTLTTIANSLREAGWPSDAETVERTIKIVDDVMSEWLACLRCSMSLPTSDALHIHYNEAHR